ncbi:hypothetical protein BJY04DRAFT_212829 [Aspergillus karnatakaensis]|uniref:NmrA/HSCARG family protein n=1 Tax=Aspergillus karnatakaensis TaxID=1810916 RepID=UPI003CCD7B18
MSTIFICGATGTQGGSIIANLPGTNLKAHAITRDLTTPASQASLAAGVTLFQGNFDDEPSLRTAMAGCTSLFLNLMPSFTDLTLELTQAKRIIAVAKDLGINHIIYSSGLVRRAEQSPYWDPASFVASVVKNKMAIEEEVRSAGFKHYTILRPGSFMSNYLAPFVHRSYAGLAEKGEYTTALLPESVIPLVDPTDIGKFAVAAFLDPARFGGKEVEIASELMVSEDVMEVLSKATGSEKKVHYMTQEEIDGQAKTNPFVGSQLVARDMAQGVDMDEVRSWGVPLGTFEGFLEREKDRVAETYSKQ